MIVKVSTDLRRSDVYEVTKDFRLVLSGDCQGNPPVVDLDSKIYKKVRVLDKRLDQGGLPSLKNYRKI